MKKVRGVQRPQKKNEGGMLVGPSHEEGGIPAIVGGSTPVELEGGEYIMNAQTVDALGQPFLDKLNSTQTEYHTGGFEAGQLPNPSYFDEGGRVNKKKKLQTGGNPAPIGVVYNPGPKKGRRPVHVKREANLECPSGMYKVDGVCFPMNGNPASTGGGNRVPGLRKGGKINSPKKMAQGGVIETKKSSNRHKSVVKKRGGGNKSKLTSKSMGSGGHTHTMNIDIYGNGYTTGGNHIHQVKEHEIQMNCDDGCHSH